MLRGWLHLEIPEKSRQRTLAFNVKKQRDSVWLLFHMLRKANSFEKLGSYLQYRQGNYALFFSWVLLDSKCTYMVSLAEEKEIKCLCNWLHKSKRALPVFICKLQFWGKNKLSFLQQFKRNEIFILFFSVYISGKMEGMKKTGWQYKYWMK